MPESNADYETRGTKLFQINGMSFVKERKEIFIVKNINIICFKISFSPIQKTWSRKFDKIQRNDTLHFVLEYMKENKFQKIESRDKSFSNQ